MSYVTALGLLAAFFTTGSYIPQVLKAWRTRSAEDLSLKMLIVLGTGLALWIIYGTLNSDLAIILANAASLCLVVFLIGFKLWSGSQRRALPPP